MGEITECAAHVFTIRIETKILCASAKCAGGRKKLVRSKLGEVIFSLSPFLFGNFQFESAMPSKNKPNAFIVYAQSIKPRLIREGHTINSMADLVEVAGPFWKVS